RSEITPQERTLSSLKSFQLNVSYYFILRKSIRTIVHIALTEGINVEKASNVWHVVPPFKLYPSRLSIIFLIFEGVHKVGVGCRLLVAVVPKAECVKII